MKLDWAGPVVSGPLRRRDIARCLNALVRVVTVQGIPRGWLVKKPTGAALPAQSLDELLDALLPHARITTWAQLEQALVEVPAPGRVDDPPVEWPFPDATPTQAAPVLAAITHLPAHMKLAAFTLGVRVLASPAPVVVNLDAGRQIAARDGHLLTEPAPARTV